jgi:hypothetical protein
MVSGGYQQRMMTRQEDTAATKRCPLCGERIPVRATSCEHCGTLMGPASRETVRKEQVDVRKMLPADADPFTVDYLRGAELRGAYLSRADLFGVDLAGADLRGADLGWANLSDAKLQGADLSGANLYGTDLSDADLRGADLGGANLIGADLGRAAYDEYTVWPDGYDPEAAGAVRAAEEEPT